MQIEDQMRIMQEEHRSVQVCDDYAIIRPAEVNSSLDGKLVQEDIASGSAAVIKAINANSIFRELCCNCKHVQCSSGERLRTIPVGNYDSSVMFINKQPSLYEAAAGVPFSDECGVFLTLILQKMNVRRNDVYMTDYIKCRAEGINEQSYNNCINNFIMEEIKLVKPAVIVTNGLSLLRTMGSHGIILGLPANTAYGNMYDVTAGGNNTKIMAMYDLDKVLAKTGNDYEKCKNELWQQLLQVFKLVARKDWRI